MAPEDARELFRMPAALAGREGGTLLRVAATGRPGPLESLVTPETAELAGEAVEFLAALSGEPLERAVTGPVAAEPGLWFEPGLPQRIVADAGDAPGRMTLVQFALTRLRDRRSRSMPTHAAYDELGGGAGALVGYADESLETLSESQLQSARKLLAQLARPEGDGFVRRPSPVGALPPELASAARELAPGKLVVLSPAPDGSGEIVDLAHESLTRLWPRLRQWLTDTREFRTWQETALHPEAARRPRPRGPFLDDLGTGAAHRDHRHLRHPAHPGPPAGHRHRQQPGPPDRHGRLVAAGRRLNPAAAGAPGTGAGPGQRRLALRSVVA